MFFRFGLSSQAPVDEEAKKKARLDRFAANPITVTPEEEEKRKARALRLISFFLPPILIGLSQVVSLIL